MAPKPAIDLDEGWETIQGGIDKLVSFVDAGGVRNGDTRNLFTPEELMELHTMVYNMCSQKQCYEKELYNRYDAFLRNYVDTKILPAMRVKSGEHLLREVAKRWQDYNFIKRRLLGIFRYLDRYYVPRHGTPTLENTAVLIFQNLINEDREGNSVDRTFIKEILEIVFGLGETWSKPYETEFEPALIDSSCAYYGTKMDKMPKNSQYMLQVVESLKAEKLRAMQYLHSSTVDKLLKVLNLKLDVP